MRRECRERFPRHGLQRKPLVSDPDMNHGTCVTHVPWFMSGSLTRGGEETFPAFPTHAQPSIFTYLVRGPWTDDGNTTKTNHNKTVSIFHGMYACVTRPGTDSVSRQCTTTVFTQRHVANEEEKNTWMEIPRFKRHHTKICFDVTFQRHLGYIPGNPFHKGFMSS